jgi:hypothetical protein
MIVPAFYWAEQHVILFSLTMLAVPFLVAWIVHRVIPSQKDRDYGDVWVDVWAVYFFALCGWMFVALLAWLFFKASIWPF